MLTRRTFINKASSIGATIAAQALLPGWARSAQSMDIGSRGTLSGKIFDLTIARTPVVVDGRRSEAITMNGQLPAPLLRWREGDDVTLNVTNTLDEDTSIHWHGILLPPQMDGVPGVSFPGIKPGETFTYRFPVRQAGTYWYHTHSGFQEQLGHYGPIVIDPLKSDPVSSDREYVIVLSDWSFEAPQRIFSKLKKMSDSYNFQQRTVGDFLAYAKSKGLLSAFQDRRMWGKMRMSPSDISDVTASTYTYLINGHGPEDNWTALFHPGERIRLRFINASAMTTFNVRIPGLPLTVVQADGQNVQPIDVDEFQIGVAETYDVVTSPLEDQAFTLVCEPIDRSGYGRATLAPRPGMSAPVPPLRPAPRLTMKDMGMARAKNMDGADTLQAHPHPAGVGVASTPKQVFDRLSEPGAGLENLPHRVLVYRDLKSLDPNPDTRLPGRELELHLTGNMERYMWSFDGLKFSEMNSPIIFDEGERLRLTLVNDTMMPHPIHLHGMFFDVVTGETSHKPRKHTITVKPAEKLSVDVTADAVGEWAFHCHLLYHMHAGMFRVVSVRSNDHGAV